jgi:transcriptional regulator with XRE-family HTH domain
MWQARTIRDEVWQMAARRDPDRSALAAFADELRAQRERAGFSRDDLAARLNYSASLISMIESGHRSPSRDFAVLCDEAFAAPGTFVRLERRLRDVPFSSGFRPFHPYEAEAAALRLLTVVVFQDGWVGSGQDGCYLAGTFTAGKVQAADIVITMG